MAGQSDQCRPARAGLGLVVALSYIGFVVVARLIDAAIGIYYCLLHINQVHFTCLRDGAISIVAALGDIGVVVVT